ncbi:thioesterase family protein [Dactylosporangium sp. AC04546]|uniref:thioesterase family protein n=1 Tax=Dactylosporangium sp. AC04546 TaxID=2862460 RepID=UPI001EDE7A32|nr:thioesterase family protein [Dactylosporangium sp. AC04546]WVK87770.1 thioesterase family protein [Dactylosporangium sp. AC04546]
MLGRAVEEAAPPGLRVVRLTYEIARPVPVAPLTVTTSVVRSGRSVTVLSAAVEPFMRCTALLMRTSPSVAPSIGAPGPSFEGALEQPFFDVPYDIGYHRAMEVRFSSGSFLALGPSTAWFRMRVPLVAGESPSPLVRVLVAADSGNGISNVLDFSRFLFVNADLTVHLARHPDGEWVCLESATSISPDGIGLADTALSDVSGRIGRSAQSLFVAPRKTVVPGG